MWGWGSYKPQEEGVLVGVVMGLLHGAPVPRSVLVYDFPSFSHVRPCLCSGTIRRERPGVQQRWVVYLGAFWSWAVAGRQHPRCR